MCQVVCHYGLIAIHSDVFDWCVGNVWSSVRWSHSTLKVLLCWCDMLTAHFYARDVVAMLLVVVVLDVLHRLTELLVVGSAYILVNLIFVRFCGTIMLTQALLRQF